MTTSPPSRDSEKVYQADDAGYSELPSMGIPVALVGLLIRAVGGSVTFTDEELRHLAKEEHLEVHHFRRGDLSRTHVLSITTSEDKQ